MWRVQESKSVRKALDRAPAEIHRKWDVWLSIVELSGPDGLRVIKGFHDEALTGERTGQRSSRLSLHYRVIYEVVRDELVVHAVDVTKHDYRKKG
jgi:mRNA-degrading endonuclease RelE of RelBE toxin-antitoxin system